MNRMEPAQPWVIMAISNEWGITLEQAAEAIAEFFSEVGHADNA